MLDVFYCPVPLTVTVVPVTDHHGCATRKFSDALWYKSLGNWFLLHRTNNTHSWFQTFAGKISLSSKTTGKHNLLVHYGCCQFVTEYLINKMMKYCWTESDNQIFTQCTNTPSCPLVNLSVLCLVTSQTLQKIAFSYGPYWKCQFFSEIFVVYNSDLTPKDTTKCLFHFQWGVVSSFDENWKISSIWMTLCASICYMKSSNLNKLFNMQQYIL